MRRLRAILCVSIMAVGPGAASLAHAQAGASGPSASTAAKEQAKRLFEEGVDLEKKADYAGALAKYKEAAQLAVTPGLRFHQGYCLEMSGKLAAAVEEYDAAETMAREQNKQDVRAAIAARVDPLRARVPQIAIRLATPATGAEVQLDGVAVAPSLLEGKAFRLEPGEHTVTARAPGYKAFARKVQAPESVTTAIDVSLERRAAAPVAGVATGVAPAGDASVAAPPPDADEPPPEARRGRSLALPIASTAGAVVLAGAGVALFLVAGSMQADARASCLTRTICDPDEQTSVRTFDALALGSFIGAAGLGVLSIVLWTSKGTEHAAARELPQTAARTRLIATPQRFGVEGTF